MHRMFSIIITACGLGLLILGGMKVFLSGSTEDAVALWWTTQFGPVGGVFVGSGLVVALAYLLHLAEGDDS